MDNILNNVKRISINKNRGWRGLAELVCEDSARSIVHKMIFSFSQDVWDDMLDGYIVTQDDDNYFVLYFDNTSALPKKTQQRSVLIKSFTASVISICKYPKTVPIDVTASDYNRIVHFKKNTNNHTTSDWNCIGIRVTPNI